MGAYATWYQVSRHLLLCIYNRGPALFSRWDVTKCTRAPLMWWHMKTSIRRTLSWLMTAFSASEPPKTVAPWNASSMGRKPLISIAGNGLYHDVHRTAAVTLSVWTICISSMRKHMGPIFLNHGIYYLYGLMLLLGGTTRTRDYNAFYLFADVQDAALRSRISVT